MLICEMIQMEFEKFDEFKIFNEHGEIIISGKYIINDKHYCMGITDNGNLLFGYFNKYDFFDIYEITSDNAIVNYVASKKYFQYDGLKLTNDHMEKISLKCSSLLYDPRDGGYDEMYSYYAELVKYYEEFKKDDIKHELYLMILKRQNDKYYSSDMKSTKEKEALLSLINNESIYTESSTKKLN